ncbi:hypothetical protein GCM10022395_19370 [Snuella lapsa]|uniref:Uncharacterized protein n=1 Tax=Snuella lapsa TaxID=870481 RepID=A0ABP6XP93_9FLAO
MALTKFRKFPIKAKPSAPIKTAIALDVNNPAIIFVNTEAAWSEAILTKTFLFM